MKKFFLSVFFLGLLSCGQQNGDINRVVGPYHDKAFFNSTWKSALVSPEEWYYRFTVTDTPTNTESTSIASGHWLHPETVRFELTEKFLIAWRAHAAVPGSENDLQRGAGASYRGEPVAVFQITDHFDIAREYDPSTNEKSNVISENHDRNWDKRRYVRVDFSRNLVKEMMREDAYSWVWASDSFEKDTAYAVGQEDPANPKRSRFEKSYFELTTRQGVKTDFYGYVGGYGPAYAADNASPVVDIRFSFAKKSASDYQALPFPDHVFRVDDSGKEIRDAHGFSQTEKIWERFGFYRSGFSGQQSWHPQRGSVESGKNYNITRFNVWKQTYRDGKLIPVELRDTKPIIYYTNVEHPNSLLHASQRVASEWDKTFKEMIFYAQPGKYASIADVPQMWVLHENSCNAHNVKAWLSKIENSKRALIEEQSGFRVDEIEQRIISANAKDNAASFTDRHNQEAQAKADLERLCSALEYHTAGEADAFLYQRPGDLRYNMMNLITKQAQTPWSGLGPMLADVLSGEIIQAQANVNLWYIDRRAAWASRQIDAMNGRIDMNDLLFGNDIKKAMAEKMAESKTNSLTEPTREALGRMRQRFSELASADQLLVELTPKHTQTRLAQLDPALEKHYLEQEYVSGQQELIGKDFLNRFLKRDDEKAKQSYYPMDPPEMIDPLVVGLAIRYKDLDSKERFEKIREAVYTAVMLHEIGHNMGLAHNMAGSSDALNYGPLFWELQSLPSNLELAKAAVSNEEQRKTLEKCIQSVNDYPVTTQECLGQEEIMYSSIMDYHASWNSDLGGLGAYDRAAIKFGYAQLVEVFPQETLVANSKSQNLSRWLFLNDWKKIPSEFVRGVEGIQNRLHEKYEWESIFAKKPFPRNAVPYRYCIDSSGSSGPNCKAFDFGPDMKSQAKWNEISYWQHYFFTHFAHDRILTTDFDIESIVSRDLQVMSDYGRIMRWYYFFNATDPDFVGSDAEKDYLSATVSGLNHFSHVLGHPTSGQHASVPLFEAEKAIDSKASDDRLAPTKVLFPWSKLDKCVQLNIAQIVQKVPKTPREGYFLANVSIGDGRPFYIGLTSDYEDSYINYVGSFFAKYYAGYFLSTPSAWFPRTDAMTDPRTYAINWYRLFPKEVGKLFHNMITENWSQLGPVVEASGKLRHRDLLDPVTLQAPDYSGMPTVMPGVSSFLPYRAMFYASALLSGNKGPELDPIKSMNAFMIGGKDGIGNSGSATENDIASFKHPFTGNTYQAYKVGEFPVAFDLIHRLNVKKEKFERLNKCIDDVNARATDTFCHCVKTGVERSSGAIVCCQPSNPACPKIGLSKIDEGLCSLSELKGRRDQAREDMEHGVGFVDDMRWLYENYASIP